MNREALTAIAIRTGVVRWKKSGRYEILSYIPETNTILAERLVEPVNSHVIYSNNPNHNYNCVEIGRADVICIGDLYL